ncbi:uncharacterized protein LOC127244562 [Andrographis paniculata]|uniref:uncharacterized protein LOC127244562 n=1 Tax=Andrographis paniculata TaxID=175694 RepID=UPI0021E6EEBE|nr:uncharacterized protein LOC127244562 [Andrographis paniculata]
MAHVTAPSLCQLLISSLRTASRFLLAFFRFVSATIFSHCLKNGEKEICVIGTEVCSLEEEEPEVCLKFKFPTYQEFRETNKESGYGEQRFPVNKINETVGKDVYFSLKEKGFAADVGKDDNDGIRAMEFVAEKAKTELLQNEEGNDRQFLESMATDLDLDLCSDSGSDSDSDSDSSSSIEHMNLMNHLVDSYRVGFSNLDGDEDEVISFEIAELEHNHSQNMDGFNSCSDTTAKDNGSEVDSIPADGCPSDKTDSDMDENELESLWEHQELVEQLKMELKKVKATGLPTILEESEPPKIIEDLRPWKMDEFHPQDSIGELHKFYKSYREKMRKFDIINYQKMYAMGVLQVRDPLQFMSEQKPSAPTALKSVLLQRFPILRNRIHGSDPMKRFIQELHSDLETVYVAQMCLSWEFLNWQYEKVLDLWDSDPRGVRRYNEVAGEFQQFQVLLQRFVEDEPFQEQPRMQNYVRTRSVLRSLLQVPVVREDKNRGKKKDRQDLDYAITSDMLVEIVEESIRIFWRFVRADKDCATSSAIAVHKKSPELSNPEDLELLAETKKTLLKKDRKLKDLLRSENCVFRKIRRCREGDDESDQVLYFFSQVDMKLVCRVLNMAKVTRDQLAWCHRKLQRIGFVDRKIYVEPAFLLFPS